MAATGFMSEISLHECLLFASNYNRTFQVLKTILGQNQKQVSKLIECGHLFMLYLRNIWGTFTIISLPTCFRIPSEQQSVACFLTNFLVRKTYFVGEVLSLLFVLNYWIP